METFGLDSQAPPLFYPSTQLVIHLLFVILILFYLSYRTLLCPHRRRNVTKNHPHDTHLLTFKRCINTNFLCNPWIPLEITDFFFPNSKVTQFHFYVHKQPFIYLAFPKCLLDALGVSYNEGRSESNASYLFPRQL